MPETPRTHGETSAAEHAAERFAELDAEAALGVLGVTRDGLAPEHVLDRLRRFGPNRLAEPAVESWSRHLVRQFFNLFASLLLAGAVLAWVAGLPQLAWAILVVIGINGSFSFWQEHRAERAVRALSALLPQKVTVRRAGRAERILATDVVPGEILLLAEGDRIAADARVLDSHGLRVDLSSLTGESHAVPRSARREKVGKRPPARVPNLVFAGSAVQSGRGEAVVFRTGVDTELSRIAKLTHAEPDRPSPLELELRRVTRTVTFIALAMGSLFFAVGVGAGGLSVSSGLLFALGIIVANVPEGLLPTLTLALALSVRRMAARRAVVKRLSAVEALGATTLILTDKTGTLTQNEMTVRELWTVAAGYDVAGFGYGLSGEIRLKASTQSKEVAAAREHRSAEVTELLKIAALCCDAHLTRDERDPRRWRGLGDPTECAILVAAAKAALYPERLGAWPRVSELTFDSARKRMTTIHLLDDRLVACVKGAPSQVLPHCTRVSIRQENRPLDPETAGIAESAHRALAARGFRVLAVARRELERDGAGEWSTESVEQDLVLLGFVAMEDTPRPEVAPALAACRAAGVRALMVTGDSGLTGHAIGTAIGMYRGEPHVVTGAELDELADERLDILLAEPELLFARATPEHKLRLVQAYQRLGEVVAVTGDGVNDAPALKRADVGIAMGETGTDVAREAADVVLTDDDFATIVAAIREGRAVYDNVRKFITYIFASNVPEAVPFIVSVLLGVPLPLTVVQILAVDLGTDLLPALALGADPPASDVMRRPPRRRTERLLDAATLLRSYAWLGSIQASFAMGAFYLGCILDGWRPGVPIPGEGPRYSTATTMTFAAIVACQVGNVFACRSRKESAFSRAARPDGERNRFLLPALAVELGLLLALLYVPQLARWFGFAPLRIEHWLLLACFGPALFGLEEARKAVSRRVRPRSRHPSAWPMLFHRSRER